MTRKQLVIVLCGTTALVLVVLLMILLPAGGTVDATAPIGTAPEQVAETDGNSGLSGGNDCYCTQQSQPNPDSPAPATE